MPIYAYGTMPEIPPNSVTEKHEETKNNESEDDK
jgi:hypothetical protein